MRRFWDARAREDAFYFVDNRIRYRAPAAAFWSGGRADLDELLDTLEVSLHTSDELVEIGCGVGRLTRVIAERVGHVRALDVSERMLAIARTENAALANVEWLEGDGVSLAPVDDDSADVVISDVVFQHIPDPAITLGYVREIGRVLKPGGIAAFQVSNDASAHTWTATWSQRVRGLLGRGPRGQAEREWVGSAIDLDELRAAAADGGLRVEKLAHVAQYMLVRLGRDQRR